MLTRSRTVELRELRRLPGVRVGIADRDLWELNAQILGACGDQGQLRLSAESDEAIRALLTTRYT